jgi:hypothetical protein
MSHDHCQGVEVSPVHVVPAAGGVYIVVGFQGEVLKEPHQVLGCPRFRAFATGVRA